METPTRTVTIHRAELLNSDEERASFEIECSSGTYVRTLIETLEDAYCESLRRTAIGMHRVPEAASEEISVEELMAFLPEVLLDDEEADAVGHGRAVRGRGEASLNEEPTAGTRPPPPVPANHLRLTHDGRLIAIARADGENLRPEVVLA